MFIFELFNDQYRSATINSINSSDMPSNENSLAFTISLVELHYCFAQGNCRLFFSEIENCSIQPNICLLVNLPWQLLVVCSTSRLPTSTLGYACPPHFSRCYWVDLDLEGNDQKSDWLLGLFRERLCWWPGLRIRALWNSAATKHSNDLLVSHLILL